MSEWMKNEDMLRESCGVPMAPVNPTVTVLVGGEHIDITYACEFDCTDETIELPENLPGGSEVYVDGKYLCTTAIPLAERAEYLKNARQGPKRRSLLSVAIGAVLYGNWNHG